MLSGYTLDLVIDVVSYLRSRSLVFMCHLFFCPIYNFECADDEAVVSIDTCPDRHFFKTSIPRPKKRINRLDLVKRDEFI